MAIACLRLVTFRPEPPLRSVPRFLSRIAFSTFSAALAPYFRPLVLRADFLCAAMDPPCR
jgi:hypothetical protein